MNYEKHVRRCFNNICQVNLTEFYQFITKSYSYLISII